MKMITQQQQQSPTTTIPQHKEQTPLIQQIRQLITQQQPKCQYKNISLYVCINKNCTHQNPFICIQAECQCSIMHQVCPQIRNKSFNKVFFRKDKAVQMIVQKINERTDKLVDDISDFREKIIEKFKNGQHQNQQVLGSFVDKIWLNQHQQHICSEISQISLYGKLMNHVWQTDQKIDSQKKHELIITSIDNTFDKFTNQIETEFQTIFKIVLQTSAVQKFYWSRQLRGDTQLVNGRSVKKVSGSTTDRFTLLKPSLTKLKAKKVQWQMRVIKLSGWVGLGICMRSLVEKNKFDFLNYTITDHGSYIISSNGYTWAHQNQPHNSTMTQGVQLQTGHEIVFELDLQSRVLKYTNKTNQRKSQLNITHQLKQGDDFHICSCLGSGGDEVQIVGNVIVDGRELKFDDTKR